jgi:hypothetical protein
VYVDKIWPRKGPLLYSDINKKHKHMSKENKRFWLNRGCIHYIINWNAGLDCFGNKIKQYDGN